MLQLLTPADTAALEELDAFVSRHPRGHFLQSPAWRLDKPSWDWRCLQWELWGNRVWRARLRPRRVQ
ncbi:MAG: aminoacyltransferase [Clostridiales bacterium]|nr:aminoacyltransferase [Clostridiales bacterium]